MSTDTSPFPLKVLPSSLGLKKQVIFCFFIKNRIKLYSKMSDNQSIIYILARVPALELHANRNLQNIPVWTFGRYFILWHTVVCTAFRGNNVLSWQATHDAESS